MPNKHLFRADVSRGLAHREGGAVDREAGIIHGYSVIAKGPALGHGMEIDDTTLDQVVELGQASKKGIKARFGHPNMSNEALGTFLGRSVNFRRDGDQVRADLHIDPTAYETPNGDLGGYVLGLAASDPEAFGASIVFSGETEYRVEKDGRRSKDDAGDELPPLARINTLHSADVVDEPAANENGFFGHQFFGADVKLSAEASGFLRKLLDKPDAVEKVIGFLNRFKINETADTPAKNETGGNQVDKETTPEVVDRYEDGKKEGFEAGAKEERARVLSICKEAFSFPVDVKDAALSAIERGESLNKALLAFKDAHLSALRAHAPKPAGPNADPEGEDINIEALEGEEKYEALWAKDANLRAEFGGNKASFLAFQRADAAGLVKIKKN